MTCGTKGVCAVVLFHYFAESSFVVSTGLE